MKCGEPLTAVFEDKLCLIRAGLVFKRAGMANDSVTVSQTSFPSSMLERQLIFSHQRQLFHLKRDLAILKSHL